MRLPLICWCVNMWVKYMLARLLFNLILEILSDKIHIFKVICCLHLKYRIQFEHYDLFSVFWTNLHLTGMERRDAPHGLSFVVQIFLCYWTTSHPFSVSEGKAEGKKQLEREDEGSNCSCFDYCDWWCRVVEVREEMCLLLFGSIHLANNLKMNFKNFWILIFQLG